MAQLLGQKDCIESLRIDVKDLQFVVEDVLSVVGSHVKFRSWRSPDVFAHDLDIQSLIEKHKYSKDVEENQLSHIVLIELVVDRLILIMQLFDEYLMCHDQHDSASRSAVTSRSIGVIVRRYWNKLSKFCSQMKDLNSLKNKRLLMTEELQDNKIEDLLMQNIQPLSFVDPFKDKMPRKAFNDSGIQTMETLFTGCSSCKNFQTELISLSNAIFQIPNPISKADKKKPVKAISSDIWMAAHEITSLADKSKNCLKEVEKSICEIEDEKKRLKIMLEESGKDLEKQKSFLWQTKTQLERKEHSLKAAEERIKCLESAETDREREYEEKVKSTREMLKESERRSRSLNEELEIAQEKISRLEDVQEKFNKKLSEEEKAKKFIKQLEEDLQQATDELENVSQELSEVQRLLKKEQLKNHNNAQHSLSLQNKQESLLNRIELMDEKNEEMQQRINEMERMKEEAEEEKEKLKVELCHINKEKAELKSSFTELEAKLKELTLDTESIQSEYEKLKQEINYKPRNLRPATGRKSTEQQQHQQIPNSSRRESTSAGIDLIVGNSLTGIKTSKRISSCNDNSSKRIPSAYSRQGRHSSINKVPSQEKSLRCEYCHETCSTASDLELHESYCVYRTSARICFQ